MKALQTAAATAAATLVVLLLTGAKSPPRKVEPLTAPCDVPCLEAKNAALQKLAVKRLKGWDQANKVATRWKLTAIHQWTMQEAITVSSIVYHVSVSTLTRRMFCESHGHRYARNPSGATSYWQFLPSTWLSTPFARLSIYSPFGQAMAAGWMMGPAGRSGEWVCR